MAGSWNHAIEKPSGKLLRNEDLVGMLENGGDVYEFAQEAYGMVWYLASWLEDLGDYANCVNTPEGWIEEARQNYKDGLNMSPGIDGHIPEED